MCILQFFKTIHDGKKPDILRFFTANLLKRVVWNSARSQLLHTITLAICGFRNLRYFARSQNQQIAGFYCTCERTTAYIHLILEEFSVISRISDALLTFIFLGLPPFNLLMSSFFVIKTRNTNCTNFAQ